MPAPPALTKAQERQIRARVRAGADLPALQHLAEQRGWKVSRTKLGEVLKQERDAMGEGAPAPAVPIASGDQVDVLAELQREVASLRARLDSLLTLPRVKLSEAATAAVHVAQTLLSDPTVDPKAKAAIMAQLPDLIGAARKALEAEQGGGDEELGE